MLIYQKEITVQENCKRYYELLRWAKRIDEIRARRDKEESEPDFNKFRGCDEDE